MAEYIEREVAVKILRDEAKSAYPTPYHIPKCGAMNEEPCKAKGE